MAVRGAVGVCRRGFGELDPAQPIIIGSLSKAFTATAVMMLVDEGKLRWDQRVTDVYPQFRLGSDETTRNVLIRHLVCACTGLPRRVAR